MTARFGRNKRRQARVALATEKERGNRAIEMVRVLTSDLKTAKKAAKGREERLAQYAQDLAKLQDLMADVSKAVRDVFGDNTVLLPPDRWATPEASHVPERMPMPQPQRYRPGVEFNLAAQQEAVAIVDMCDVLTAESRIDHYAQRQHVYLVSREKLVAYAIDEKTAHEMPKPLLVKRLAEAMAPLLAEALKGRG
jgi:hypothetical protein